MVRTGMVVATLDLHPKSGIYPQPSRPLEGAFAIVTNAGWAAVDAEAPLTRGADAYDKGVWS